MKQLNEQFHRMQKLAGLITEEQANENFAANFVARGGMKTKYGSGTSSDSDSKGKNDDASNEKVVAFFANAEKDSGFKAKADKLEADFQATWNSNKERYEKSGKWNPTRQDMLKREWDSKKERLFQDKFAEENRDFEKTDPAAFSKAYALVGKMATGEAKVEDLKTSAPPSLLGKIKGLFKEENIKEQLNKEQFMTQLNEQFRRMQVLAGIITEGQLNEYIEQVDDYISGMWDASVSDEMEEGEYFEGVWEKEEYGDEEEYESADEFNALSKYLASVGGKATLEGNPDIDVELLPNGDIKFGATVTFD